MGVCRLAVAHPLDGRGKETTSKEDAGVFRKEAENQAGHKVVKVVPAFGRRPVGIILEQLDIEFV